MLPVAHVALGEPEVERGEQLAQPVLGHRVRDVGAGDDVLGVEAQVVGQEFQRLHLLGAYAARAVRDVAYRLVTPLVRELAAGEPRVALEVALPDSPGQRLEQPDPVRGVSRRQDVFGPRPAVGAAGGVGHESGVEVAAAVPAAFREAGPVAVVADAGAVDAEIEQHDVPAVRAYPRRAERVVQRYCARPLGELDAAVEAPEAAQVVADIREVLDRGEHLCRGFGDAALVGQTL